MTLPPQLQDYKFRFYRIQKNGKLPKDKAWNSKNNFSYSSPMIDHWDGNVGVVCGIGDLIVIDFDDRDFHESIKSQLPKTFRVITATKRLPHYYYILKGASEMKKTAIKDSNNRTLCDIQMRRSGVVAPGSVINRRYYEPNDTPIAEITLEQLNNIFDFNVERANTTEFKLNDKIKSKQQQRQNEAYIALYLAGVKLKKYGAMRCPFHDMHGNGNLSIADCGKIVCFNCGFSNWAEVFLAKALDIDYNLANKLIKMGLILKNK